MRSDNGVRLLLLLLIVGIAVVMISGCVQKSVYPSEKETIIDQRIITNDQGIPAQTIYVFAQKQIDAVTVQREMIVQTSPSNLVTVILNVVSNATGNITDTTLEEEIPQGLATNLNSVNFTPQYSDIVNSNQPLTVSWEFTLSGDQQISKTLEYTAVPTETIDKTWIEDNVLSPYIEVSSVNPNAVPLLTYIFGFGDSYYSLLKSSMDFYIASGIYGATLFILVLLYIELLSLFAAYVVSLVKKTPLVTEVYKFMGHGRKDNITLIAMGIILIVIGIVVDLSVSEMSGSAGLSTFMRLGSNTPKTIGAFLLAIGMISIYYAIIDILKSTLLGERYSMGPLDIARTRLRDLNQLIGELENSIMTSSESSIDTETEEVVMEVERRRMDRLNGEIDEENSDQYMPQILRSISNVQTAMDGLMGKKEILDNWPAWRSVIDQLLIEQDRVGPELLASIPQRWRRWSLAKYMSEHLGESITVDNGSLVKIKTVVVEKKDVTLLLNGLMQAGKIEGVAAMRKDGLLVDAMLPKEVDQNLIAAVSAKVIANADMASIELDRGKTRFVMLKCSDGDAIIYAGRTSVLVALIKSGETLGFVVSEMAKAIEKLDTMI